MLMDNSTTLSIDLNAKDKRGRTAFHFACGHGQVNVAKMLIENSATLRIDLNSKDDAGKTAYNLGLLSGSDSTVALMQNNAETLNIDLGPENNKPWYGTSFDLDEKNNYLIAIAK